MAVDPVEETKGEVEAEEVRLIQEPLRLYQKRTNHNLNQLLRDKIT